MTAPDETFEDLSAAELAAAREVLRKKMLEVDGRIRGCSSYVQRMLSCSYNHVSRVMAALEAEGFISAPDAYGARKLLQGTGGAP